MNPRSHDFKINRSNFHESPMAHVRQVQFLPEVEYLNLELLKSPLLSFLDGGDVHNIT